MLFGCANTKLGLKIQLVCIILAVIIGPIIGVMWAIDDNKKEEVVANKAYTITQYADGEIVKQYKHIKHDNFNVDLILGTIDIEQNGMEVYLPKENTTIELE